MTDIQPVVETVTGAALRPCLPAVAALRARVFRDWPYLYDAEDGYEERYLRAYAESPGAAVVLARAGGAVVGAATCQPMAEAHGVVRNAALAAELDVGTTCYFGESVLLPAFRGQGIGVAFFAAREAHARALRADRAAFCAVRRDADDPRRPAGAGTLDRFWRARGYERLPGMTGEMAWREVGGGVVPHVMDFWARRLA